MELDSGTDILGQLGPGAAALGGADGSSDGSSDVRRALHQHLRASKTAIHAAVLQPSTFYHIGTMGEYMQYYSSGIPELDCAPQIYNAHMRLPDPAMSASMGMGMGLGMAGGMGASMGFGMGMGMGAVQQQPTALGLGTGMGIGVGMGMSIGASGLPVQEFEGAAVMQCLLPVPGSPFGCV